MQRREIGVRFIIDVRIATWITFDIDPNLLNEHGTGVLLHVTDSVVSITILVLHDKYNQ